MIIVLTGLSADGKHKRTFGWYSDVNKASLAIEKNAGDMHEARWAYLVLEGVSEGVFPFSLPTWYKWNRKLGKWQLISQKPKKIFADCNFAMG